jgi:hypothetical protein
MKKVRRKRSRGHVNGMRPEYRFDYTKARPNRFARDTPAGGVAVILDPDVASVFGSSKAVNALLRSVISAMPSGGRKRKSTGRVRTRATRPDA